ncbi:sensor histidine kinase, partial [Pedobacter sp.]
RNGSNCFIQVKDNGIGISKEEQGNLFKLKALSTFGTNNEKGVGLGLLLCKEFAELQNGKIWYERNEDSGSTFVVSFAFYEVERGSEI